MMLLFTLFAAFLEITVHTYIFKINTANSSESKIVAIARMMK